MTLHRCRPAQFYAQHLVEARHFPAGMVLLWFKKIAPAGPLSLAFFLFPCFVISSAVLALRYTRVSKRPQVRWVAGFHRLQFCYNLLRLFSCWYYFITSNHHSAACSARRQHTPDDRRRFNTTDSCSSHSYNIEQHCDLMPRSLKSTIMITIHSAFDSGNGPSVSQ